MKNICIVIISALAFISCNTQKSGHYTITGNNWDQYETDVFQVFLFDTSNAGGKVVAEAIIKEGKFNIEGEIAHPQNAIVSIYGQDGEFKYWKQSIILEEGLLQISFDTTTNNAFVNGGKYNDIIFNEPEAIPAVKEAFEVYYSFFKENVLGKESSGNRENFRKYLELSGKHRELLKAEYEKIYKDHPDPYARLLVMGHGYLFDNWKEDLEQFEKELGLIPEIVNKRHSMQMVEESRKNRQTVGLGKMIKDFSAKDLHGDEFHLADVLKKNAYTLVEFWASWCGPCRGEIPHMKKAYSHFKDKGFEIVSFTLDHEKERWQKASDEEQIPWINVGDLRAYKSPVVKMYGVMGVPANYLVNKEGEIIAMNLRQEKLDEKLKELLGE